MHTDDKAGIRAANEAWCSALNAMLGGDPAPFADIYSHAADVGYMSAEGSVRVGWDATWADWQAQAELSRGGHVEEKESHTIVHGDMAVVQRVLRGEVKDSEGVGVPQTARETSVFRREDGEWKVVAHQVDALRNWVEVAGPAGDA